jgi:hypothetical protein
MPSDQSNSLPTSRPTSQLTERPTGQPSNQPIVLPSSQPTVLSNVTVFSSSPSTTGKPTSKEFLSNTLSVFPVGSNHFRGSLFLLGSGAGSSSDLDTRNIILNNVLPDQRSFILFGQKNNRVIPNI